MSAEGKITMLIFLETNKSGISFSDSLSNFLRVVFRNEDYDDFPELP